MNSLSLRDPFYGLSFFDSFFEPVVQTKNKVSTYKDGDDLVFEALVPGVRKEDLNVDITDGILTIKCEKSDKKEGGKSFYSRSSSFVRSYYLYDLSEEVPEDVGAKLDDGILTLRFPNYYKEKESKTKQVKIEVK